MVFESLSHHSELLPSLSSSTKRRGDENLEKLLKEKEQRVHELDSLLKTISRGKYMWESTFDAITSPVMIVSSDYIILRANRSAARYAKIDVREMIGMKCHEALAGFDKPCHGCPLELTLQTSSAHCRTLDPFAKNSCQFEVNAYPIVSISNEKQAVVHYRDVTEEKELQHRLLQSEKMAAIGTLAGGVAHEINNPLGGILAFAQLTMRDLDSHHPAQKDLKEIEEAALRCKRIVQDLLDFSRQNRDEKMVPVQINEVLHKIQPLIEVQAKNSRIEIIYDLGSDLPAIKGSLHKLQQVFINLVTNAYQAMKNGGTLTIKTGVNAEGKVVAEVHDTGPGITKEHLRKIFDPYFTTKGQGEGTGLGLSITYGIIQEHRGHIEVKSRSKKGTTFVVSFPALGLAEKSAVKKTKLSKKGEAS